MTHFSTIEEMELMWQELQHLPLGEGIVRTATGLQKMKIPHFERNLNMRITVDQYEKAKEKVEKARKLKEEVVDLWDAALKEIGDVGKQTVIAIQISDDGKYITECTKNGKT